MDRYKEHLTQYEEMVKMIDLSMKYAKDMGLNPYYMYRQKHMLGNLENIGYAKGRIRYDGMEYKFKLDAYSGALTEWEAEPDD